MPKSQQTDPLNAGFVLCVDCMRRCASIKIRLTNEVEEMNKQELIDEAVHSFSGVWPNCHANDYSFCLTAYGFGPLCTQAAFEQRARELGYLNGYRWGVEYPTNGKKPDLPDDASVQVRNDIYAFWTCGQVGGLSWSNVFKFKITNESYKPADTSYLSVSEIPESKSNAESVSDWYDYESQEVISFPPVGVECEALIHYADRDEYEWIKSEILKHLDKYTCACFCIDTRCLKWSDDFRPLDHATRKAEAEKNKVANDAFYAFLNHPGDALHAFKHLYDLGYLRAPAN